VKVKTYFEIDNQYKKNWFILEKFL
jgi:hypothetical protein